MQNKLSATLALTNISHTLNNYQWQSNDLLCGLMGKIVFDINYLNLNNQNTQDLALSVERNIEAVCNIESYSELKYSTGIAGMLWFIKYLDKNQDLISFTDVVDDDFCTELFKTATYNLDQNNDYDLLHGAIGLINFSLFSTERMFQTELITFLHTLHAVAIKDKKGFRWNEPLYLRRDEPEVSIIINYGQAHGLVGIVAFLLKCKQRNISAPILDELIHGAIAYFISTTHQIGISKMPSRVIDDAAIYAHQLAWCYGGLSSAYTILKVGKLYANEAYITYAMDLLSTLANPDYYEAITLKDTSLCHGTSSTAYLFGKLYKETEDIKFKIASDYWINKTCEQLNATTTLTYQEGYDLLEGLSGAGLVLIAYLNGFEEGSTSWDSCLYLS